MIRNLVAPLFLVSSLFFASVYKAQGIEGSTKKTKEYVGEAAEVLSVFDVWAKASSNCNSEALTDIYHRISCWPSVAKEPFYGIENTLAVFEGMCKRKILHM